MVEKKYFTVAQWFYWIVRAVFGGLSTPPRLVANWATDRFNKSYFKEK